MSDDNKQKAKFFYAVALGLKLGILIALPLVIFLFIGVFLDSKFGTLPVFLIAFILLSFTVTFFGVRNLILPFLNKKVGDKN